MTPNRARRAPPDTESCSASEFCSPIFAVFVLDLSPQHIARLERIAAAGFSIVAFPLYAQAVGIRRGEFAALLKPETGGGFSLFGEAFVLIGSNPGVRIQRSGQDIFVWKKKELPATPQRLAALADFRRDLELLLQAAE